jgi:putative MATE family efflux protein
MTKTAVAQPDLTHGPILQKLLKLALPIMGAQAIQMLYNLTDMFYVGRLGAEEIAATGAAGLYMWLSVAFMLVGSVGAGIGISQSIGAGDEGRAKAFAQNALSISVGLGILFGLTLSIFPGQMLALFNFREENVIEYAAQYLTIIAVFIPVTYVSSTLSSVFNASGRSKVPMYINLIGMLLNVILDPLFIFTFGLGVRGAAIATVISQCLVCTLLIWAVRAHKQRPFASFPLIRLPDRKIIAQILKWTWIICAESALFTFLVMITSRREAFFGADALAISRVGSQIESLTWLVGGAFGSALTAFIGQNFGAGEHERLKNTFKLSTLLMAGYGSCVAIVLVLCGERLFSLFIENRPDLAARSASYMLITAIAQIPMCLEGAAASTFRGKGRTWPASIVNITGNALRVPMAYILSLSVAEAAIIIDTVCGASVSMPGAYISLGFLRAPLSVLSAAASLNLGLSGVWIAITISCWIKGAWSYAWYVTSNRAGRV